MNKNHLLIVGLPLAFLAHSGAAPVTWTNLGTSTVNESSIDLTGDLVHAGRWGGGAQTVTLVSESIVFADMPAVDSTTPNPGSANAIASAGGEHSGTDVFNPPGAIDPAFESVMEGFAWDGPNPKRLVLNNLVVGASYQVQIFVSDDRGAFSGRTQRWSDNVASGGGNETNIFTHGSSSFVIGRFSADSTTQTIYGHGVSQGQNAVNAYVLRQLPTTDTDSDGLADAWELLYTDPPSSTALNPGDDLDSDNHSNLAEQAGGSNPLVTASIPGDIDGDGLGDTWESTNFGSLSNPNGAPGLDPDGDRDTNLVEFTRDTDPNNKFSYYSSTNDLVPDSWKAFYSIGLGTVSSTENSDGDGLFDDQEFTLSTNPILSDTDDDGLSDSYEVNTSSTNPLDNDSDNDGLLDGAEVATDPNDGDTDDDGYLDGAEITAGSNPLNPGSTPFNLGGEVILIDPTHNNGSFETGNGKLPNWGSVDFWDEWTGVSTANGDSGTDVGASATQGTRVAFLQPNNAAYNMTTHVVAAGDIYTFQWDHTQRNASNTVSLVWNNGGTVTSIAASQVTSTTVGNGQGTTYQVLAGDPAIGSTIGLGIKNNNSQYPEVDNFILVVTPGTGAEDSDSDGLADSWESTYFGGLGETAAGDFDNDGTSNLTEFRLGLIPNSGTSRFGATYSSTGLIQWPSVTGVTFKIERSTTLVGTWTTLESAFPGTAGTASYTDPAPPVGKAFYKVELNP
jgi:hypothetical protein